MRFKEIYGVNAELSRKIAEDDAVLQAVASGKVRDAVLPNSGLHVYWPDDEAQTRLGSLLARLGF